jgi:alkaline phosphatase
MDRRKFFKNGSLLTIGSALLNPFESVASTSDSISKNKKAKNIIFLVSDGMSIGTLTMTDVFLQRNSKKGSEWMVLYRKDKIKRALMNTASASSIVTDSAAASSAWGSGFRVNNGSLNVGTNNENYLPIWQKFKRKGKMVGCVTTAPITHATPAGFCVNSASRNSQEDIALQYLGLNFDVMMGGGNKYFTADKRKDKKEVYTDFSRKGYVVAKTKTEMLNAKKDKPILGVFDEDGLPYSIDRINDKELETNTPSLAEMTQFAIERMKNNEEGFVLQVEGGKVDWAAHANDISGLLYDQIAFDEAIKVAMDFAEKDTETLVIITTDHGNANPGIVYGKNADINFDNLQNYKQTNNWVLNGINPDSTVAFVRERIEYASNTVVTEEEAKIILNYYSKLSKQEDGLYNYKKLPFKTFADILTKYNSIGWNSMDHTGDLVELAMFGPGSEKLKPFVINTDLHYLMLEAAEIENKF